MTRKGSAKDIRTFSKDSSLVEERRLHIVRSATKVFVKNGYQRTKMRDVAEACGMSYGAAYHYIGSKQDVLYLIVNFAVTAGVQRVESLVERIVGLDPPESLRQAIRGYLEHVDELQDMFNVINHAMVNLSTDDRRTVFQAEERVTAFFSDLVERGIETGHFVGADATMTAFSIVSLTQQWAHRRWFLHRRYTLSEYANHVAESILSHISSRRRGDGVESEAVGLPDEGAGSTPKSI